jgi:hypothetical protein
MKKILIILNALMLGIIVFMSCNKRDTLAATTVASLCSPCGPCTDYSSASFPSISPYLAKSMFTDYKNLNQPLLQIDDGSPDANRIWFSLEALKSFIWQVEQEVCKHRCTTPLKMGVRIYYARYPQTMQHVDLTGLPSNYAKHHTLFMVPTYQDATNENIQWDFDPWYWGRSNCTPTPLAELIRNGVYPAPSSTGISRSSIFFPNGAPNYYRNADGTISQWTAMNHGGMTPPPPPSNTDGTGFE